MKLRKSKFLSFRKARKVVRELGIKSFGEYKTLARQGKISEKIPIAPDIVYVKEWVNWFDWLGTKKIDKRRKYSINNYYFKKWTPNMAYVLGLWWADGCISKHKDRNSYGFMITLKEEDKYLLEEIAKDMGVEKDGEFPIYKNITNNCYSLTIHSKMIYDDVVSRGGKERKSLDIKFPNVPKKYLRDFVRGYFDGDGCVSFNNGRRHKYYVSLISSGSKEFVYKLHEILKENIRGLSGRIGCRKKRFMKVRGKMFFFDKDQTVYNLVFSTNDTRRLRNFMYDTESTLKMKRKYDKMQASGEINIATFDKKFWPFKKARSYVRKLGLKRWDEYAAYNKSGQKPLGIPSCPAATYKKEYQDARDWLGTSFWSFEQASDYVRKLGIRNRDDWREYCVSGERPINLPSNLERIYREEWRGFKHFVGLNKEN
jgi:hypothetical protein